MHTKSLYCKTQFLLFFVTSILSCIQTNNFSMLFLWATYLCTKQHTFLLLLLLRLCIQININVQVYFSHTSHGYVFTFAVNYEIYHDKSYWRTCYDLLTWLLICMILSTYFPSFIQYFVIKLIFLILYKTLSFL